MRALLITLFFMIGISAAQAEEFDLERVFGISSEGIKVAGICFFEYEQISGMNKICVYSCVSGNKAITISSVQLCPLSIND